VQERRDSNDWARFAPFFLVAFAVVFTAVLLRSELRSVFYVNDAAGHSAIARFAEQRIRAGRNPFDAWYPYLGLGSPFFAQYQSLSHIVTGALRIPFGASVFRWINYLLICTWPVTIYVGARLLGLDRWQAATASLFSPLLVNINGYGLEWGSFVWLGSGMWSMLWALWLMPIAIGLAWRAVAKGERYALAAFVVGLTCALHFITGYLVLLCIGVFVLTHPPDFLKRLGRGALIGFGGIVIFAFVFVPAISGLDYQNVDSFQAGTFWIRSYGPSKVLPWLFRGEVFDYGRAPVVSLCVLVGVLACAWQARKNEWARLSLGIMILSLCLWSGRRVVGPVLDRLPGGAHLFLHRYIIGVHFAGLLLAGVGAVWIVRTLWSLAQRLPSGPARDPLVAVVLCVLVALVLVSPLRNRKQYAGNNRSFIAGQVVADNTVMRDVVALIDIAKRRNDGRIYAGGSNGWGHDFMVDQIPVYELPVQLDADSMGFYLRTDSLSSDIEPWFDETNAAQYDLFNLKYVLLPSSRKPTVPTKVVATRGDFTLYQVDTSGYLEVVDTTEPVVANNSNMADVMRPYLSSPAVAELRHPLVAFDGAATPAPSTRDASPIGGPPGRVLRSAVSFADGRFTGRVEAARPAWVMLKESYSPRWRATVDGKPVPARMLAPSFVGVPVPAGTHVVVFEYHSRSSYSLLFALGVLVLVALVLVPWAWRRYRKQEIAQ
jgi:hypothetical protein